MTTGQKDMVDLLDALGLVAYDDTGRIGDVASVSVAVAEVKKLQRDTARQLDALVPMSRKDYHEDEGPVLWWKFPIVEPPYCGTELDDDFPEYVTHWTRIPIPFEPVE